MPYSHLIAATVMTLGVCQGHSLIASFSILTTVSCGPSNIAELLVTARRYAKRGICRRRVSVCLSHSGIVSKRLNVGSRKQRRTIAP